MREFLTSHGGEMGALTRAFDWASTPVGPVEAWPQSLRTLVNTLLGSRYPMVLTWGPQYTQFYNDAYSKLIGERHPAALGLDIRITLQESWPVLGPLVDQAFREGSATWIPALQLLLVRSGYREESYFTVSHAPAYDDDGQIGGMHAVCSEVTEQVIGERRLKLLRDLSNGAGAVLTREETAGRILAAVEQGPLDLPFFLLYLAEPGSDGLKLAGYRGNVPEVLRPDLLRGGSAPWLEEGLPTSPFLKSSLGPALGLAGGAFSDPVDQAFVRPLIGSGERLLGAAVAGISPSRALDESYRSFFDLLEGQLSNALNNAQLFEEEKRRSEALAELDRSKTEFFSNVSHEFRTPLTLILGPLEDLLAQAGEAISAPRATVERTYGNAVRLLKLVNTLLDFSRVQSHRRLAQAEATDVSALTRELAAHFESTAQRLNLGFSVEVDSFPILSLDREMWEIVVLNLLSNAFKHTFQGGITLKLRRTQAEAELVVEDSGGGIPAEELPRIFERFYRARGTRSRTHEGTGIGLALVKELLEQSGGGISAESEEGRGTRMTARIPLIAAQEEAGEVSSASLSRPDGFLQELAGDEPPALAVPSGSARPRVLLAEDNSDMREYIRGILETEFDVDPVGNGQEALNRITQSPPDILVSDIMMPVMDGLTLLREARAQPEGRLLPVVLLSARAGAEAAVSGLAAGADDYLVKPFSAKELLTRVRHQWRMAELRREVAEERTRRLAGEAEAAARLSEEQKAVAVRDEFLMIAAHELRTPLTALKLQLQILQRAQAGGAAADPARLARSVEMARTQAERLSFLVNDLLDLSQVQHGNLHLRAEEFRVDELVAGAVARFDEALRNAGCRLSLQLEPVTACLDRSRLEQVILNLLSNSAKYAPGSGITVKVYAEGSSCHLIIGDDGPGIPCSDQARIFERFERAGQDRGVSGLGVGLYLVRKLVEAQRGTISLKSEPAAGAEFRMEFPLGCEPPPPAA